MNFEKPGNDPKEGEPVNLEGSGLEKIVEEVEKKEGEKDFAQAEAGHQGLKGEQGETPEELKDLTQEEIDDAVKGLDKPEGNN